VRVYACCKYSVCCMKHLFRDERAKTKRFHLEGILKKIPASRCVLRQ
jgi:hypothetical protein